MPLTEKKKQELLKKYGRKKDDTGSPEVQIALLTERISQLTGHFKMHKKDHHNRRGLVLMVGKRRKLLKYLNRIKPETYVSLIAELGLRR